MYIRYVVNAVIPSGNVVMLRALHVIVIIMHIACNCVFYVERFLWNFQSLSDFFLSPYRIFRIQFLHCELYLKLKRKQQPRMKLFMLGASSCSLENVVPNAKYRLATCVIYYTGILVWFCSS